MPWYSSGKKIVPAAIGFITEKPGPSQEEMLRSRAEKRSLFCSSGIPQKQFCSFRRTSTGNYFLQKHYLPLVVRNIQAVI